MKRALYIMIALLILCSATGCSSSSGDIPEVTEEVTEAISYPYQIFNTEDTSFGGVKRKTVYASITEEYYKSCDDETLGKIVEQAALDYASSHKLNAFDVSLYIEEDIVGINGVDNTTFVAHTMYAPYGDISRAGEVQAGDYSTFEFKTEITRTIRDAMKEE